MWFLFALLVPPSLYVPPSYVAPEVTVQLKGGSYSYTELPAVGSVIETDQGKKYKYEGRRDGQDWWRPVPDCACKDCRCEDCQCRPRRKPIGGTFRPYADQRQVMIFGADYCAPCRRYKQVWQGLPVRYVDIQREPSVARQYGITRIPATLVIQGGRVVRRATALSRSELSSLQAPAKPAAIPDPPSLAYVEPATHKAYVDHCVWHGYSRSKIQGLSISDLQKLHGWAHAGRLVDSFR